MSICGQEHERLWDALSQAKDAQVVAFSNVRDVVTKQVYFAALKNTRRAWKAWNEHWETHQLSF